jgi:hypothetical protein
VAQWYQRMADIPGVGFAGSPGVIRASLPEANLRPSRGSGDTLHWKRHGGTTSASPAHDRAFTDLTRLSNEQLVPWVWEGLELPGGPSDYHFLLQGAMEQLWKRRRAQPEGLHVAETFGYLDLALVEAAPGCFLVGKPDSDIDYYRFPSFELLLSLVEREGALREALALSRRMVRFSDDYARPELEAKVAALDGERP